MSSQILDDKCVELAVIINSFNRLQLLRQALLSIAEALQDVSTLSTIIIFDAGSTDGSRDFIQAYSSKHQNPNVQCIYPKENSDSSFSAGCNAAVKFAIDHFMNLKYCLFFETDNLIKNNLALPAAINLLNTESNLAAVGFTVETHKGLKAGFGCRFPTPLAFIVGQQLSQKLGLERMRIARWNSLQNIRWAFSDIVFTSPLLIRTKAWQDVGEMDSVKFPYSDSDNDWCWRTKKRGWQLAVIDIPGVIHDNNSQQSTWSANRVINYHQARFRLLLKHRGSWINYLKPVLFFRHYLEACLLFLISFKSERAWKSFHQRLILAKNVLRGYETDSL
ncbi:MAG: glycosyltransferase family 2 protein [Anaerolineaceae bacterium]|nr:glycosyltransferase family 2 protein [Anaerolineaceae bacterium]